MWAGPSKVIADRKSEHGAFPRVSSVLGGCSALAQFCFWNGSSGVPGQSYLPTSFIVGICGFCSSASFTAH
jgi:hypothetical protein